MSSSGINATALIAKAGYCPKQIKVIEAVLDTVVAGLDDSEVAAIKAYKASLGTRDSGSPQDLQEFLQTSGSQYDPVGEFLHLVSACPYDQRLQLYMVLKMLTHPIGTSIVMGDGLTSWTPFYLMSRQEREMALLRVKNSRLATVRNLFYTFTALAMFVTYGKAFMTPEGLITNPSWKALGYPGPHPEKPRAKAEDIWRPKFMDLSSKASPTTGRVNIDCDVVVVGSGAGGGIVAAELAKEGYRVILVDKANYVHPSDLPLTEMKSFDLLYERKGALATDDGALRILAGSAWGGGTAVNWYVLF